MGICEIIYNPSYFRRIRRIMGINNKPLDTTDYSNLSYEELSQISRNDHQEDTRQYDKQQNALCLVALGGISLVVAIIFFILSFKREMNQSGILDVSSLQFLISMVCLGGAVVLLGVGLYFFIKAAIKRTQLKREILAVSILRKNQMAEIE